jgi:hypothetical protein
MEKLKENERIEFYNPPGNRWVCIDWPTWHDSLLVKYQSD